MTKEYLLALAWFIVFAVVVGLAKYTKHLEPDCQEQLEQLKAEYADLEMAYDTAHAFMVEYKDSIVHYYDLYTELYENYVELERLAKNHVCPNFIIIKAQEIETK